MKYSEELDFLRELFSDGRMHSTKEIEKFLNEKHGFCSSKALRCLSKLCALGEVVKLRRGFYTKSASSANSAELEQLEESIYETVVSAKELLDGVELTALPVKMSTKHFYAAYELRPIKDTINMLYRMFKEGDAN